MRASNGSACSRTVLRVLVLGGGERSGFTMGRWHHSHRTDRNHEDSFDARTTAVTIQAQAQAPPRLPLDSSCFDTADIRPHPCPRPLSPVQRSAVRASLLGKTLASTECGPLYLGSFTPRAVGVHRVYSGHPTAVIVSSQGQAHPSPSRIDGRVTANGPGNTVISLNPSERSIKPKMAQPHGWRTEPLPRSHFALFSGPVTRFSTPSQ